MVCEMTFGIALDTLTFPNLMLVNSNVPWHSLHSIRSGSASLNLSLSDKREAKETNSRSGAPAVGATWNFDASSPVQWACQSNAPTNIEKVFTQTLRNSCTVSAFYWVTQSFHRWQHLLAQVILEILRGESEVI